MDSTTATTASITIGEPIKISDFSIDNASLSTDKSIFFPFKHLLGKFYSDHYLPEMTHHKASLEDIQDVLSLAQFVLSRFDTSAKFFLSLWLRVLIPFFVLCGWGNQGFLDYWALRIILHLIPMYTVVGFIYLIVRRIRQVKEAKIDLEKLIEMIQPKFIEKGLKWRIPKEFHKGLELIKEYNIAEESHEQLDLSSDKVDGGGLEKQLIQENNN